MRKVFLVAAVFFMGAFLAYKILSPSDEERIRRTLYAGKEAIEREDLEGVMKHVSFRYRDGNGFTYLRVKAILARIFENFDDIKIYIRKMEVEVPSKGLGKAVLLTWGTAKGSDGVGYIVGSVQEPSKVVIFLEKGRGGWKVIRAEGVEPGEVFL